MEIENEYHELSQILYIVYQPIPHKQRMYLWANGEKRRENIKMEVFKKWVIDSDQEYLIPEIMKTLMTYSFYLWDKKNGKAYYLQPNIKTNDFKKPLTEEIKNDTRQQKINKLEEQDPMKALFDTFAMVELNDAKKISNM